MATGESTDVVVFFDSIEADGTCVAQLGQLFGRNSSLDLVFIVFSFGTVVAFGLGGGVSSSGM